MNNHSIRQSLRRRYAEVALRPQGQFGYPVGRSSVERLGYATEIVATLPAGVVEGFVGVGNPFSTCESWPGEHVIDIGCGAGFDSLYAARNVGPAGFVIGVDISPEMLARAIEGAREAGIENVAFVQASAESLPVPDGWADLVISNGALNLSACKAAAFAEISRVLRPRGRFQAADLILTQTLPEDLRKDEFAWSA